MSELNFNAEKKFNCTACGERLSSSFVLWHLNSNHTHPNLFLCSKCRPRIVIGVVFLTRSGAAAAIKVLRAVGYDVLVADHLADLCSDETVFAEAYRWLNREAASTAAIAAAVDAIWQDVQRIVDPFDGDANSGGAIDDNHVPFLEWNS